MGSVISRMAGEREDCAVVAGIDQNPVAGRDYPVYSLAEKCITPADVIIDFSHPSSLDGLLSLSKKSGIPLVIATTGYSEDETKKIREAAKEIPVFFTFNMSLGINLMTELAQLAAKVLGGQFDIEIVEKHHSRKIDAPSGTAIMLADALASGLSYKPRYVYDRHSVRERRGKDEIGIHAVRGGTIVGEHEIIFAGQSEVILLTHSAYSRDVFAAGAISAALFMKGKSPGLYNMKNLIG